MPEGEERFLIEVHRRIAEIPAAEWDSCARGGSPFVSHAFLDTLEASGSVSGRTGWLPQHLALKDAEGHLLGCVPLYLKSHSYGEYVFDWGWAEAYERAGGRYYPKLQSSVPFTPVTGGRLLVRPDAEDATGVRELLIGGLLELASRHEVSSLHVTFPREAEWRALGGAGFLQRQGTQYHWENQGYESFDDFLAALASRKRKAIRKEREKARESGLAIRQLVGREIEPRHWDAFYEFYKANADRKWGQAYLTRAFFEEIGTRLGERALLVVAEDAGRPVAGAFNVIGEDTLYGRNWGCIESVKFLHFECCYYQAIDFAIRCGLKRVEAGAQGEHKIQRGYLPCETYSAHWIADPGLRAAVADFLRRERQALAEEREFLAEFGPFKKGG